LTINQDRVELVGKITNRAKGANEDMLASAIDSCDRLLKNWPIPGLIDDVRGSVNKTNIWWLLPKITFVSAYCLVKTCQCDKKLRHILDNYELDSSNIKGLSKIFNSIKYLRDNYFDLYSFIPTTGIIFSPLRHITEASLSRLDDIVEDLSLIQDEEIHSLIQQISRSVQQ